MPPIDADRLKVDHLSTQETLNFWKQLTHVLKYFRAEEDPKAALPKNFIQGFLEVRSALHSSQFICQILVLTLLSPGTQLENKTIMMRLLIFPTLPVMIPFQTATPFSPYAQKNARDMHASRPDYYAALLALNASLDTVNLSTTTSQRSIRSLRPFSRTS